MVDACSTSRTATLSPVDLGSGLACRRRPKRAPFGAERLGDVEKSTWSVFRVQGSSSGFGASGQDQVLSWTAQGFGCRVLETGARALRCEDHRLGILDSGITDCLERGRKDAESRGDRPWRELNVLKDVRG